MKHTAVALVALAAAALVGVAAAGNGDVIQPEQAQAAGAGAGGDACAGSAEDRARRVYDAMMGGADGWADRVSEVLDCEVPTRVREGQDALWSSSYETAGGRVSLEACGRLNALLSAAGSRWEGSHTMIGEKAARFYWYWLKALGRDWPSRAAEARFASHAGACEKAHSREYDEGVVVSHETASKATNAAVAEQCAQLRAKTTPESGAAYLHKILAHPWEQFEKEHRGFFGCLVPLVFGGSFTWDARVDAKDEAEREQMCDLYARVMDAFVEPYVGNANEVYTSPYDLYRQVAERKYGKDNLLAGAVGQREGGIRHACTPQKNKKEMGMSDPPLPGSEWRIKVTVPEGLPTDFNWPTPWPLIPFRPHCHYGVTKLYVNHLGRWKSRSDMSEEAVVSMNKFDPLNGYMCQIVHDSRTYCIDSKEATCLYGLYFKKTRHGRPHMLVDKTEGVTHCPYEWIDTTPADADRFVHYSLRIKPGYESRIDRKPCADHRAQLGKN